MEPKANNLSKGGVVETIDLNGDYPLEVLSYYIWGQNKRPEGDEIVNECYANRKYGDENCRTYSEYHSKTEYSIHF